MFDTLDGRVLVEVAAILMPVLIFIWIVMTVMALHKRDVYFWSLGSTWTTIVACPAAIIIMSFSGWSGLHDPSAPPFQAPIIAGGILYAVALAYAVFYNFGATKSAMLAVSTSLLQQFAVLGVIFLFLRWQGNEVNRRQ